MSGQKKLATIFAFVICAFLASCEFQNLENGLKDVDNQIANSKKDLPSTASTLSLTCDLQGPTSVTSSATSATYTMSSSITPATYLWQIVSGTATIACPTCATTSISFPAGTSKVQIKCTVTSGDQGCFEIVSVSRTSAPPCVCPTPVVTIFDPYPTDPDKNCNTTSNGLYSFTVSGTSSGDQISWSGNSNVNVQNGQGTTAMTAYIYNTSVDFIVTCTVTRVCGATTYVRTATYSSNISQQCQYYGQSTTGDCGIIIE